MFSIQNIENVVIIASNFIMTDNKTVTKVLPL